MVSPICNPSIIMKTKVQISITLSTYSTTIQILLPDAKELIKLAHIDPMKFSTAFNQESSTKGSKRNVIQH